MSIIVTGHKNPDTDSICSAISYAHLKNALGKESTAVRAGEVNKETQYALDYFKVEAPELLESISEGQKVIFVDHNELGQAIDGMDKAEIMEVIDHHRLGGLTTANPILIRITPVGCTATIIANMFWLRNVEIPVRIAGLLLSAIISDTVLFKSPTCTEQDKHAAEQLSAIAGVDIQKYGMDMLKAGADISDMSAAAIAKNDSKPFSFGKYKALVAQVSVMDAAPVLVRKAEITAAMEALCKAEGYDLSLVMVTDIIAEGTDLLVVGEPKAMIKAAFGKELVDNCVNLPGVMSRKKQIVPQMTTAGESM